MIRTSNSCCGNEAGLVEKFIGTAYDVVKTVYDNLGELQFIYDFLNKYGVLITVDSIDELKALPTAAKYTRVYTFSATAGYGYTDYLYIDGDITGVIPNDPSATGSWIVVASSTGGGSTSEGGYILWVYAQGSALGGETTIAVPNGTIGVPFIIVEGYMNTVGYGFTFDAATLTVTLAQPLEQGDEVVLLLSGTPAVPDNPNISDWVVFNWLYNGGAAVGGEQVISIPYTFQSVPAIFKNGLRYHPGLASQSYTIDSPNQRILLTEPLATNDRLVVQVGGESTVVIMSDRTIQEVARAANVRNEQVILSTNTTSFLNDKTVVFDEVAQRIYGLPVLPTNVYISSVSNGQLTYNPGSITVNLLPMPNGGQYALAELSSNATGKGDSLVTVQQPFTGAVPITQHVKNSENLSFTDFGATGNGVANDSISVNAALAQRVFPVRTRDDATYLVPTLSNPMGTEILGKGQLVKAVTGGLEMQNSYVDAYQRMTGQENLAAWFKELMQPTAAPKIVFSGDSTTAGDGTSAKFKINLLVAEGIRHRGLQSAYGINAVNKGHSGASTSAWNTTYVTEDIAENAALYVVRWGINDVKDVNTFATNLREGLTKYRAARPFETNSILLMMPNSTYDIPNGRDAKWYEKLHSIYVQAARDFKCAFLDTYALTQNSKGLAGILMDDPYGDGRAVHPNDILNSIIAGYIVDTIVPEGLTTVYGRTLLSNYSGGEDATILSTRAPAEYTEMMSYIRVIPANGWPIDGNAITQRTMDGSLIQYIFGYKDADRGTMYVRMGRAGIIGGESATWSPFYQVGLRFQSADIVVTGVYQVGSSKCNRTGTQVVIDGNMTTTAPTNINVGTTIGTVPAGYRPTRGVMYGVATMVNAAGSSFVQVPVNVQTNGTISVAGAATGVSLIYLNISYDIQ